MEESQLEPYSARSGPIGHGMGRPAARTYDESQTLDLQRQRQVRHTRPTLRLCGGLGVQTGRQKARGKATAKASRGVSERRRLET